MKIIRTYFFKEFYINLILSFTAINAILIIGNLIKLSDLIIRKGVNYIDALLIFVYLTPYLLEFSLPLATLLGILLCISKFTADNEIIAIKTAGISFFRILIFFLTIGLVISLTLLFFNTAIIPKAHFASRKLLKKITTTNPLSLIEPKEFIDDFKGYVLFVNDINKNIMNNLWIYEIKDNTSNLIYAQKGEFVLENNILKINLFNGFLDGPDKQYRAFFKNSSANLEMNTEKEKKYSRKTKDMGIKELIASINNMEKLKINTTVLKIELHRKIATSFSTLIFVLLGFGIAGKFKHREKSINFAICIFIAIIYFVLTLGIQSLLLLNNFLPAYLIWIPNIVFLLLGGYLSFKVCKY